MTWAALAEELDFVVSEYTLKRHIGSMHYHNCIACYKGWISGKLAPKRKDWEEVMKERYPFTENWRRVRFSDEVHWAVGPEGKVRIIRKPGERLCSDCIQHSLTSLPACRKTLCAENLHMFCITRMSTHAERRRYSRNKLSLPLALDLTFPLLLICSVALIIPYLVVDVQNSQSLVGLGRALYLMHPRKSLFSCRQTY
jgi:hypothetical protein